MRLNLRFTVRKVEADNGQEESAVVRRHIYIENRPTHVSRKRPWQLASIESMPELQYLISALCLVLRMVCYY